MMEILFGFTSGLCLLMVVWAFKLSHRLDCLEKEFKEIKGTDWRKP